MGGGKGGGGGDYSGGRKNVGAWNPGGGKVPSYNRSGAARPDGTTIGSDNMGGTWEDAEARLKTVTFKAPARPAYDPTRSESIRDPGTLENWNPLSFSDRELAPLTQDSGPEKKLKPAIDPATVRGKTAQGRVPSLLTESDDDEEEEVGSFLGDPSRY